MYRLAWPQDELWKEFVTPEAMEAIASAEHIKGQMDPWQYALLYKLAKGRKRILEIGTFLGKSARIMSLASTAEITSLTISEAEAQTARQNAPGVEIIVMRSWDYIMLAGEYDMVFVDGDHKNARIDLPWFNKLSEDGLILFHDYSEDACPPVWAAVNKMGESLGRVPDVCVIDSRRIGMAGFYRQKGELWAK